MRPSSTPLTYALVGALASVGGPACLRDGVFQCVEDGSCRDGGAMGRCEPSGYCSFADLRCESGARYSRFASPPLAGRCTTVGGSEGGSSSTADDGFDTAFEDGSSSSASAVVDAGPPAVRTPVVPACGNGYLEDTEICDDGNLVDADGCNVDCVPSGTVRWTTLQQGDAGGNDYGFALALLPDGNIITAGRSAGDSGDAWFSRFDAADGSLLRKWLNSTEQPEEARAVVIDDAANIYGAGWYRWADTSTRREDQLVGAYFDHAIEGGEPGAAVEQLWMHRADSTAHGDDRSYAAALRANRTQVVVFGKGGADTDIDSFVRGYPLGGTTPAWSSLAGIDARADEVRAGVVDADEHIYAAGVVTTNNNGRTDAWIGELGAPVGTSAMWLWHARLGTATVDELAQAIAVADDDTLLVGGHVGLRAMWARFDRAGLELERWVDPGDQISEIHGVAVDGTGAFVTVGYVESLAHLEDITVTKYDVTGTRAWADRYDGDASGNDRARAVVVTEDDDVIVVGHAVTALGASDLWLRRYAP